MKSSFSLRIYYEDTDHSGRVYHPNYLKYFERAREHLLGPDEVARLEREDDVAFVVYSVSMQFKDGARFGDEIRIDSEPELVSEYRVRFLQRAIRVADEALLVDGQVEMVCVTRGKDIVPLPSTVVQGLGQAH